MTWLRELVSDGDGQLSSMRAGFLLVLLLVCLDVLLRGMSEWHALTIGAVTSGKAAQRWRE